MGYSSDGKADKCHSDMALPVRLGPVVEIGEIIPTEQSRTGKLLYFCPETCDFCNEAECSANFADGPNYEYVYPPNCPGPAPDGHEWRLAMFVKGEEESDESD